jgi:hypothetical protein
MKTAVEWLVDNILTKDEIYDDYGNLIGFKLLNTFTSSVDLTEYVEQANKMFEDQIIESWVDGVINWDSEKESQQYYNETFKSE